MTRVWKRFGIVASLGTDRAPTGTGCPGFAAPSDTKTPRRGTKIKGPDSSRAAVGCPMSSQPPLSDVGCPMSGAIVP